MAHLAVENLTFSYPGAARAALSGVSLDVEPGCYLVICGKSGCGKTTLVRHLKTVLTPHGTSSGRVLLDGVELAQVPLREQSAQIGFVMQNPDAQVVTDKVWHELAFGLESLGCDQTTMRLRVAEMASYFGIQGWFHQDVRALSGGQKQLLNLASVMAMQPSVLVLDEPTSQLDPIAAADFLNTVRKINLELGTTVIITEHRLEEVFPCADRVVVMEAGGVAACASARAVAAQLCARDDDMICALPAPVRIYHGIVGAAQPVASKTGVQPYCQPESQPDSQFESQSDSRSGSQPESQPGSCPDPQRDAQLDSQPSPHSDPQPDPHPASAGYLDPSCPLTVREGRRWLSRYCEQAGVAGRSAALGEPYEEGRVPSAVSLRDVWLRYERDGDDVLRGCCLEVPQGSIFAVVGGNAAGKSTMLKAVCGIVKPYRGVVRIFGRKLKDYKAAELFQGCLALLPQDPQNLFARKTVREDLLEMLEGISDAQERACRLSDVVELVGISSVLDSHPFDLSGGEQQRAALAKVLLANPKIVLLDEPTKGIDGFFKHRLADILNQLKSQGTTVVMVSHDVEFCARYADLAAMFFDGSATAVNTPQRFFSLNSFYTTAANRMSRHVLEHVVTDEDVVALCQKP